MSEKLTAEEYWQAFVQKQPDPEATASRFYEVFHFSSSAALANELAQLVLDGVKTATSSLLWEYEVPAKPVVKPGDLSVVTDWNKNPVCIMETTEVRLIPFKEVDAQFAYDYGEEERTLEWWHREMWESYEPICASLGKEPSQDMIVVCERFRVVFK